MAIDSEFPAPYALRGMRDTRPLGSASAGVLGMRPAAAQEQPHEPTGGEGLEERRHAVMMEDAMKTARRVSLNYLEREARAVEQDLASLRRAPHRPVGMSDLPDRRRISLLDAAMVEVSEQHREVAWHRVANRSLALAEAMDRIREGTYGLCADCGCRIPERRLRALPTATLCVRCQEARESTGIAA